MTKTIRMLSLGIVLPLTLVAVSLPASSAAKPRLGAACAANQLNKTSKGFTCVTKAGKRTWQKVTAATVAPTTAAASAPPTSAPSQFTPEAQKIIAAARGEGDSISFNYYMAGGQKEVDAFVKSFNEFYGLNIKFKGQSGVNANAEGTALNEEQKAGRSPSTDILQGGTNGLAAFPNLYEKIDWSFAPWIPKQAIFADGLAVAHLTRLPGLTYNSRRVSPDRVPKTLVEYVNLKQYRLATSSFALNWNDLASPKLLGEAKLLAYIRLMSENVAALVGCTEVDPRMLNGEFDMFGLDCGEFEAFNAEKKGIDYIKRTIFPDAATTTYLAMGVLKGGARPNLAKLFVAYMAHPTLQAIQRSFEGSDLHFTPDSLTAREIKEYEAQGIKFTDINYDFTKENVAIVNRIRGQVLRILTTGK